MFGISFEATMIALVGAIVAFLWVISNQLSKIENLLHKISLKE